MAGETNRKEHSFGPLQILLVGQGATKNIHDLAVTFFIKYFIYN